VSARLSAPGPQEKRFAAYIEGLATAAGHQDRHGPVKDYCKGLLLPGERKSIDRATLEFIAEAVRDGKLVIPISLKLPLSEAAEAQAAAEKGGVGKILLVP